jgi:hypothetical protein
MRVFAAATGYVDIQKGRRCSCPLNVWGTNWLIFIKFVVNSTPLEEMARNIPFTPNADTAESI